VIGSSTSGEDGRRSGGGARASRLRNQETSRLPHRVVLRRRTCRDLVGTSAAEQPTVPPVGWKARPRRRTPDHRDHGRAPGAPRTRAFTRTRARVRVSDHVGGCSCVTRNRRIRTYSDQPAGYSDYVYATLSLIPAHSPAGRGPQGRWEVAPRQRRRAKVPHGLGGRQSRACAKPTDPQGDDALGVVIRVVAATAEAIREPLPAGCHECARERARSRVRGKRARARAQGPPQRAFRALATR